MKRNIYGESKVIKNPIKELSIIDIFMAQKDQILGNDYWRKDVFNDVLEKHTVDTVCGFDTNVWETGVEPRGGKWIIVEQYESRDKAKVGHKEWVQKLEKNPNMILEDIFL